MTILKIIFHTIVHALQICLFFLPYMIYYMTAVVPWQVFFNTFVIICSLYLRTLKTMIWEKKPCGKGNPTLLFYYFLIHNYWATVYLHVRLHVLIFFIKVISKNNKNRVFLPLCWRRSNIFHKSHLEE